MRSEISALASMKKFVRCALTPFAAFAVRVVSLCAFLLRARLSQLSYKASPSLKHLDEKLRAVLPSVRALGAVDALDGDEMLHVIATYSEYDAAAGALTLDDVLQRRLNL